MVRSLIVEASSALEVVSVLLEGSVKVCAVCEKDGGQVNVPPGTQKTHGYCKRHYHEALVNHGFSPDKIETLLNKPDDHFCSDTSNGAYDHAEHAS